MKKITLAFTLIALAGLSAKAQITISQSNMPAIGDKFNVETDNSGTITSAGGSGANQTWNFSTMAASSADTITVVSPSNTPSIYANQCPSANLAYKYSNTGSNEALYEYYNSAASSYTIDGIVFNSSVYGDIMYKLTNPWSIYTLPATYKSHWKGNYRAIMKTYDANGGGVIDSVEIIENGVYSDSIDSWGNMTTSVGTFNSLRDMHLETDADSTYYYEAGVGWAFGGAYTSKNNFYSWYTNQANFNYMLVEMNVDSTGAPTLIEWLNNKVTGINELSNNGQTTLFPNPVVNNLNIETTYTETGLIKIYDMAGKAVETDNLSNGKAIINVSNYAKGMYLYTLTDKDGTIIDRNKFTVIK